MIVCGVCRGPGAGARNLDATRNLPCAIANFEGLPFLRILHCLTVAEGFDVGSSSAYIRQQMELPVERALFDNIYKQFAVARIHLKLRIQRIVKQTAEEQQAALEVQQQVVYYVAPGSPIEIASQDLEVWEREMDTLTGGCFAAGELAEQRTC